MRTDIEIICISLVMFFFLPFIADAYFLPIFLDTNEGKRLKERQDYLGALVHFQDALFFLDYIHELSPSFETSLVMQRIDDVKNEIVVLKPLTANQILELFGANKIKGFPATTEMDEGFRREKEELNPWNALLQFRRALEILQVIHLDHPQWEKALIETKIKQCQMQIDRLQTLEIQQERKASDEAHGNFQ